MGTTTSKKRKNSQEDDAEQRPKKKRTNPFLPEETKHSTSSSTTAQLLDVILRFTSEDRHNDQEEEQNQSNKQEDVEYLVTYLLEENNVDDDTRTIMASVSRRHVAFMILPWSIQQATTTTHSSMPPSLVLRAMNAALQVLDIATQKRFLTTRVLGQLVAHVVAQTIKDVDAESTDVLQSLYSKLLHVYRPTMEVACRKILPLLTTTTTPSWMLKSTHQWIYETLHLSRKGNPKTTFQLVASPDVVFLLRGHNDNKLLKDALFHSKYHQEGFFALLLRSNKKKSSFQSYQSQLFTTVEECLKSDDDEQRQAMIELLPDLLEAFFEQSSQVSTGADARPQQQQQQGSESNNNNVAFVQFRLFCQWTQLVLDTWSKDKDSTLLVFLARMLTAVCQNEAAKSPAVRSTALLQTITQRVLQSKDNGDTRCSCLCCLLRLHHPLLHNETNGMIPALRICADHAEFIQLMVDTYQRLRQQQYIIVSLLGVKNVTCVVPSLAQAMQTTPLSEMAMVLECLLQQDTSSTRWLAPHVLPHIPIPHATAAQAVLAVLQPKEEEADSSSAITKKKNSSKMPFTAEWLDLQARCLFWLGVVGGGSGLLEEPDRNDDDDDRTITTVRHCYRLREWHEKIQVQERKLLENEVSTDADTELLSLQQQAVQCAQEIASLKCWSVVAQHVEFWIPLVQQSSTSATSSMIDPFLEWALLATANAIEEQGPNDKAVASGLLRCASFYQHQIVAQRLHWVGMSCIAAQLASTTPEKKLLLLLQSPSPTEMHPKALQEVLQGKTKTRSLSSSVAERVSFLIEVLDLVNTMNAIPAFIGDQDKAVETIVWCYKMDRFVRSILPVLASTEQGSALKLMVGLRTFIARLFCLFNGSSSTLFHELFVQSADAFVSSLIRGTLDVMQLVVDDSNKSATDAIAVSTGDIVRHILRVAEDDESIVSSTPPEQLTDLVTEMGNLYKEQQQSKQSMQSVTGKECLAILLRSLLSGLRCARWSTIHVKFDQVTKIEIGRFLHGLEPFLLSETAEHDLASLSPTCQLAHCDVSVLTATSALWLPKNLLARQTKTNVPELVVTCIQLLKDCRTKSNCDAPCYLAGLLAAEAPCLDLAIAVCRTACTVAELSHKAVILLEACYCRMMTKFTKEELTRALEEVLVIAASSGCGLRFVRFTFQYAPFEQVAAAFESSRTSILTRALQYLVEEDGQNPSWNVDLSESLKLIGEMIKCRDVHTFSEFELSIVLSRMNAIVAQKSPLEVSLYCALVQLYLLIFQRYTKPLYACVANVIDLLVSFLADAMKSQGASRDTKAQQFVRVCELLASHRDVYKKHVLGLVIAFLDTVDNIRHDALLPAIYYVMEAMTTYEMDQLNSFLDDKLRAGFKTIRQSYQKIHESKGH